MKFIVPVLLALLLVVVPGCKSLPQVVVDNGPAVLQVATNLGVRAALSQAHASREEASFTKAYLVDARKLIDVGAPPATALDQIAELLNSKITNPTIRAAIQTAISNLKAHVTLPVSGVIPENVKVWVLAVLNGAIDGCDTYLTGLQSPAAAPLLGTEDKISFR